MGRLFGTDGVRGVANTVLTNELSMKIGRAAAAVLTDGTGKRPRVLIGTDTRASAQMLQSAVAAGLCSVGADVTFLGVLPTPAVAYLAEKYGCDAAVMISASHNPCEYNGIKIFKSDGYKLPDELEDRIEEIIVKNLPVPLKTGGDVGRISECESASSDYIDHLKSTVDGMRFDKMRIALDCANGSASVTAQRLFKSLGAECFMLSASPDGVNINRDCGSTHLENISRFVRENHLSAGFAFDGDADRLLCVDENGDEVDGDEIIAVCAKYMKERGKLKNDTAVVTVMTNMGFFDFCDENGIRYEKTKVGDRYVLGCMLEKGFSLGGEQSGHVIFRDFATTGDGQLTALQILKIMKETGKSLSLLSSCMTKYPQFMINIPVSDMGKERLYGDGEIRRAIEEAERELGNSGRVLVRASGTEPLIRVMLEGKDKKKTEVLTEEISAVIRERLI